MLAPGTEAGNPFQPRARLYRIGERCQSRSRLLAQAALATLCESGGSELQYATPLRFFDGWGFSRNLAAARSAPVSAAENRVTDRLFLVRDRPGTPTQFQMIVGAGCVDEEGGNCRGLAHYLEHLVLVGRNPEHKERRAAVLSRRQLQRLDQPACHRLRAFDPAREGAARRLEKLFGFYAARLKDFSISEADAERERNVVRQEHDWRVGSRPSTASPASSTACCCRTIRPANG